MPPDDQVASWVAALVDRTSGQLRADLDALVQQVRGATLAPEVSQLSNHAAQPGLVDARILAAAVATARIEERQAELALAATVLEAMTALDAAGSLSDILDVLVDRASAHTGRVLLVVKGPRALTGWRSQGYTPDATEARTLGIPLDDDGLVARAARTGATEVGRGPATGGTAEGSHAETRAAIAIPLSVDGHVVAVLYADEDGREMPHVVPSPWPEVMEVLARHAARCLESMTVRRVPELLRRLLAERT
jgi:hypothetical protein